MVLQYYLLETDHDPGTGVETVERDLPRIGITKSLIFDAIAQCTGTSAGSRNDIHSQLDKISIGVVESNSISEIDGEDLDALNVAMSNHALVDLPLVSNSRNSWGHTYPFDPFMIGTHLDYNRPFGVPGSIARKVTILYAADVATDAGLQIDEKRTAIAAIVRTDGVSGGYMAITRDSYTATAGSSNFTTIPPSGIGSKVMGVFNFELTSAADITGDGDRRTAQGIREQAITVNRRDLLGPIYSTTPGYMSGFYETGAISDEGFTLWDLGLHNNNNNLGVPTTGGIPAEMEIRTLNGATQACRVHALILNTNLG